MFVSNIIYADDIQVDNEMEKEDFNLEDIQVYLNGEDRIEINMDVLDDEGEKKVKAYISEMGIEKFEKMLKEEFRIKEEKETLISDSIFNLAEKMSASVSDGTYSKKAEKGKTIYFEKGNSVEYISIVGITVNVKSNKITSVKETSFNVESMSSGGSYGNIRIPSYISPDGDHAGATANYDVEFSYFIAGDIVPIKYTKNTTDSVRIYVSELK